MGFNGTCLWNIHGRLWDDHGISWDMNLAEYGIFMVYEWDLTWLVLGLLVVYMKNMLEQIASYTSSICEK